MIRRYTLEDGSEFQTIILPKGTLLFRGIDFNEYNPNEYIRDFFNDGSCIPPTKNVYFYPIPYAGISIQPFNVYIAYTVNYNIELLLLVKPSNNFKPNAHEKDDVLTKNVIDICRNISEKDKCGYSMSDDDPCFTETFIKTFPNILGYIGIDANDVDRFYGYYKKFIQYGQINKMKQLIPSIVSNSRGFTGIPEIVLHPLHLRRSTQAKFKTDFNTRDKYIQSIIKQRARYNYTPLLYISDKNIFTLKDLLDDNNILKLMNGGIYDFVNNNKLFDNINIVMKQLISDGYEVDGYIYRAAINPMNGFYIIRGANKRNNITNKNRNETFIEYEYPYENNIESILSFSVKIDLPEETIVNLKESELLEAKEQNLNRSLKSLSRTMVLDKGNYIKKYRIEEIFPRSDLPSSNKNARRRRTRRLEH